jgi:hypothetical protein
VGDISAPSDEIARRLISLIDQPPSIDLRLGEVVNGASFFMSLCLEVDIVRASACAPIETWAPAEELAFTRVP